VRHFLRIPTQSEGLLSDAPPTKSGNTDNYDAPARLRMKPCARSVVD
jgi:hypothetical protein